jgi:hypothetical protein
MKTAIWSRSLHDVGLAAWFGGTLANAVALNAAAGQATRPSDTGAVVNAGWDRWTPINAAAIGAHLAGSVGQLVSNAPRVRSQPGVAKMALAKTALTAAALGVTGWSRVLGKRVAQEPRPAISDGTTPTPETPEATASAQKQLAVLQWVIPGLTGALVVLSAFAGEQQRPAGVIASVRNRFTD